MPIAPYEILEVAKTLSASDTEACIRSSVSRAYYALYHGCLKLESTLPVPGSNVGPDGGVHQQLINRLRNPAPELRDTETRILSKKLAALLEGLKTKRTAADYDLLGPFTAEIAVNACDLVCKTLENICPEESGSEAGAPIRENTSQSAPAEAAPEPEPPAPSPSRGGRPALRRVR